MDRPSTASRLTSSSSFLAWERFMRTLTLTFALALALAATPRAPAAEPAAKPTPPDPQRVRQLVERLDDDRFAVRQQADQELRGLGASVLPLLEQELPRAS